ncbi:MAG: FtsW/RodA/SpoVE family cell cycle protein [Eubacteriales bacterium]|nr:FtsW/RodA/SpoVE family cell cycle protein [Eubacteriales bacterium]
MAGRRRDRIFQFGPLGMDTNLLVSLFFVMVFGFIMIYSASYYKAGMSASFNNDSMYFLKRQVVYSAVGVVAMLIVSAVNYHVWSRFAVLGYAACLVLILLLKSPIAITANHATRWIQLGPVQLQVAEPIKLIMIVFMSTLLVARGRHLRTWVSMIRIMIPAGIIGVLVWKVSDNMSTAVIILGTAVLMVYIVHPEYWRFFLCAALVAAAAAAVVYYVGSLDPSQLGENFRFGRIRAWLDPYEYEDSTAMQALQGLYAIGSGGLWGKGLGNSIQKLGTLPEPYNDYIFTIICEELGIFGAGMVIMLFIYLLYRIYIISQTAEDMLGRLITIGVFSHIALQVVLNLLVVTGLFPTTGVTLPFFSYGGSASVFLLIEFGLVLSVNKYSVQKRLDDAREERFA